MIERLYIENFRTLVSLELRLRPLCLLLGENGSGKTNIFDALLSIQLFLSGDANVMGCFPPANLTRWQKLNVQRFELEGTAGGVQYKYELAVEFDDQRRKARVQKETLTSEGKPLFEFADGIVQLYRDDSSRGPAYPHDWTKSGLSSLYPRPDNTRLTAFKDEMARMVILKPCPVVMSDESRNEDEKLNERASNFVSWYRYLLQSEAGLQTELFERLREVFEGFDSFKLAGPPDSTKQMLLRFRLPEDAKPLPEYGFGELSDGQRMLILLYTLVYGTSAGRWILMIDEPDNYLSLREVQPWLTTLSDMLGTQFEQAVLISHHSEIINVMADRQGLYLDRDKQGPTRVIEKPKWTDGLTPAETVARGWVS